jgi:hypothetical protein
LALSEPIAAKALAADPTKTGSLRYLVKGAIPISDPKAPSN